MGNKLYSTPLAEHGKIRWKFLGAHTCCVKAISLRYQATPVKMIGVHTDRQLYFKPTNNAPLVYVANSGSVRSISSEIDFWWYRASLKSPMFERLLLPGI